MALVRWQTWNDIDAIRHQFDQLFDELAPLTRPTSVKGNGATWSPAIEVKATDVEVIVRAELPGIDAKDLDVQVAEDRVAIRGERKSETRTEEKGTTRSEFRYGKFERIIPLPAHVQPGGVKAEYTNGILSINLPKAEEEKRKVVKVNLEQPGAGVEA